MLMEGTGRYFFMLFIVFLIVYITVKICLVNLFKRAKQKPWKAYIPIYTTYVLVDLLNLKKRVFYFSLIPIVNIYFYYVIYQKLIEGFDQNPKDAIWYVLIPMYKFPELIFKRPKFKKTEYELTKEFVATQKMLFEKQPDELPDKLNLVTENTFEDNGTVFDYVEKPEGEIPEIDNSYEEQTTFTDPKINFPPTNNVGPSVCSNCGAKLAANSSTCFFCGKKLN